MFTTLPSVAVWLFGCALASFDKVTLYQAQLVLGWVTMSRIPLLVLETYLGI